jgi:hypothetical protein
LITGGVSGDSDTFISVSAEIFNPTNETWTSVGLKTTNRSSHTATLLSNGKVLVAGGDAGSISHSKQPNCSILQLANGRRPDR